MNRASNRAGVAPLLAKSSCFLFFDFELFTSYYSFQSYQNVYNRSIGSNCPAFDGQEPCLMIGKYLRCMRS